MNKREARTALRAPAALAALLAGCSAAWAASPEPFEAGGKWGFRAAGSPAVLVEPLFQRAGAFQEGLAPVMISGKWGYLDEAGRFAIEPVYLRAQPFSGGAAGVVLPDGRRAVIDSSGTVITTSPSPAPGAESEGLVLFAAGGRFGFMEPGGKTVIPPSFAGAGAFREGAARVLEDKWGFVNRAGKFIVRPEFDALGDFSGGLAAFLKDGKWGYLDRTGAAVIANNFHEAGDFSEGLAAVRLNSSWGYIDRKGAFAIWPAYYSAGPFSGGLAVAELPALSPAGIFPPARLERIWIDRTGRPVYISSGAAGDGMEVIVSTDGRFGFAADGKPLIIPAFDSAAGCSGGLCLVGKDGRYGFIDRSGGMVLPTGFEEAAALGCGLYRVRQGLKYGLMNSTGSVIAQAVYDAIEGEACGDAITGFFSGIKGRLSASDGSFTVAAPEPQAPSVMLSGNCERAGNEGEAMPYAELAGYCGVDELKAIAAQRSGCVNCRLALAELYSSTSTGAADPAAAAAVLGEAIELSTATPALLRWRAGLLTSAGGASASQATEDYKRLIALEPEVPEHYRGICEAYAVAWPLPEGPGLPTYFCDKAVMLEPGNAAGYVSRGMFKRALGDNAGALEDLRSAVKLAPEDARVRLARARLSAGIGEYFRTIFDCSKILERDGNDPDALEERGLAYVLTGACGKAQADLEAAGRLRPGPGNLKKLAVYYWNCENDVFKTAWVAEDLIRMGDKCGGACWPPAGYENYLAGFYGTAAYGELLARYGLSAPVKE